MQEKFENFDYQCLIVVFIRNLFFGGKNYRCAEKNTKWRLLSKFDYIKVIGLYIHGAIMVI